MAGRLRGIGKRAGGRWLGRRAEFGGATRWGDQAVGWKRLDDEKRKIWATGWGD